METGSDFGSEINSRRTAREPVNLTLDFEHAHVSSPSLRHTRDGVAPITGHGADGLGAPGFDSNGPEPHLNKNYRRLTNPRRAASRAQSLCNTVTQMISGLMS